MPFDERASALVLERSDREHKENAARPERRRAASALIPKLQFIEQGKQHNGSKTVHER